MRGGGHGEALGEDFHWRNWIGHSFVGAAFFFGPETGHEGFVFGCLERAVSWDSTRNVWTTYRFGLRFWGRNINPCSSK